MLCFYFEYLIQYYNLDHNAENVFSHNILDHVITDPAEIGLFAKEYAPIPLPF